MDRKESLLWFQVLPLLVGVQTVTPVFFQGVIAGSEFLTYSAKKLYICLSLLIGTDFTLRATGAAIRLYNEANAVSMALSNQSWSYTGAAAQVMHNHFSVENVYFSRIDQSATYYPYLTFIGYKVTIP